MLLLVHHIIITLDSSLSLLLLQLFVARHLIVEKESYFFCLVILPLLKYHQHLGHLNTVVLQALHSLLQSNFELNYKIEIQSQCRFFCIQLIPYHLILLFLYYLPIPCQKMLCPFLLKYLVHSFYQLHLVQLLPLVRLYLY